MSRGKVSAEQAHLDASARALLKENTRTGRVGDREYRFSVPSPSAYPFQSFWDSCFHAIVWSRVDAERARDELRALLAWQRPDGSIPHVIFWDRQRAMRRWWHYLESRDWLVAPGLRTTLGKPYTTEMMQPPVIAQAVERVVEASGDDAFAWETGQRLLAYYRWLARERDPDGDGLISIIAPSESGLDFSPAYDPALGLRNPGSRRLGLAMRGATLRNKVMRYDLPRIFAGGGFAVEDVLVNVIYIDGLEALERLLLRTRNEAGAHWARERSATSMRALLDRCYDADAGTFWNLAGREERPSRVNTVISLMPLLLSRLPTGIARGLVERHLLNSKRFWTTYPVPSVALDQPEYRGDSILGGRKRIWRGSTWVNTNWFLAQGLRRHGYHDAAERIRSATLELVGRHRFREYYHPETGEPGGASDFGWSTLAADL
ncbi:MAG: hypothetical protein GEU80_03850 [Dehalococcoidia bacterium]|nr:hypothetical protein [Dehalococcoidia bacterium]